MKIIKDETEHKRYKEVKIRRPKVGDYITAERIAGNQEGIKYSVALMSQICIFDGSRLPPEEIEAMDGMDFLELSNVLMEYGFETLENQ